MILVFFAIVSPPLAHDLITTEHHVYSQSVTTVFLPPSLSTRLLSSPIMLFSTISKALSATLKPADTLYFLLCRDWPFPQQNIHLWLHWPLPTVQPQSSLRNGLQRYIVCASMQIVGWQRKEENAGQKNGNSSYAVKLMLKWKGEGTVGFDEHLVGWYWRRHKQKLPPRWYACHS